MDGTALAQLIVIIVIIGIIILGNVTMCVAIFSCQRLHNPSGYIVASLAIADLLVGVGLLPFSIPSVITGKWILGSAFCNFNGFTNHVLCTASMLNLLVVSIDRYMAIFYPLRYKEYMTTQRATILIIGAWLYGLITACFPLFGWARYSFSAGIWLCVTDFKVDFAFTYFIIGTVFIIPLAIMSVVYFRIFQVAYKQMKSIRNQELVTYGTYETPCLNSMDVGNGILTPKFQTFSAACSSPHALSGVAALSQVNIVQTNCYSGSENHGGKFSNSSLNDIKRKKTFFKKELRTGMLLSVIVIVFVVSWSPFAILNLWVLHTKQKTSVLSEAIVSRLAYLNSAINPPLYCLMNKSIKNAVKRVWFDTFKFCGVKVCFSSVSPSCDETDFEMTTR